jgi:hypothetical protein
VRNSTTYVENDKGIIALFDIGHSGKIAAISMLIL